MNIIEQLEAEAINLLKQPIEHPFSKKPDIIIDACLLDPYDIRNIGKHQGKRVGAYSCPIKNVLGCYAWFNSNEVARVGTSIMLRNRLQQYWLNNSDTDFYRWVEDSINNDSTVYVAVWTGMKKRHIFEQNLIKQFNPKLNNHKQ